MKRFVLVAGLAAAIVTPAVAKDHELAFKPVTGAFFALSVPNMAESVLWYSEKLGLAPVLQVPGSPEVTVLEGGGLLVELIRDAAARPRGTSRPELVHGPFKAGFMVKDFDATLGKLRARGVTIAFGPYPATEQQRANCIIRDNAGNLIQIFGER